MYYRGAAAAIVVYDITQASSFVTLKNWVKELQTLGPENIVIAVCGNKVDQEDRRVRRQRRRRATQRRPRAPRPPTCHASLRPPTPAGGAKRGGRGLCARD